ncbi:hypothetical protein ISCGN_002666 [Ixodes scapularis]
MPPYQLPQPPTSKLPPRRPLPQRPSLPPLPAQAEATAVHLPPPSPLTSDDVIMAEVEELLGQISEPPSNRCPPEDRALIGGRGEGGRCLLGEPVPEGPTQETHRTGQARGGWTPLVRSTKPSGRPPKEASTPRVAERRSWTTPPGLRRHCERGSRDACAARDNPVRNNIVARGRAVRSNIAARGRADRDGTTARRSGSVCDGGTCLESALLPHRGHVDGVGGRRGCSFHLSPALEAPTETNTQPPRPRSPTPIPWPHKAVGATDLGSAGHLLALRVPIIHRETHEAGRLHLDLVKAQPLPDKVAAAVQTLRTSGPDPVAPTALASIQPARNPR